MKSTTITFRVGDAERDELVARAERDKVSLSDYIRVRLGLRGEGSLGDAEAEADSQDGPLRDQVADHDRRLHVLEDDSARRQAGTS